jgi:hypothetical protein
MNNSSNTYRNNVNTPSSVAVTDLPLIASVQDMVPKSMMRLTEQCGEWCLGIQRDSPLEANLPPPPIRRALCGGVQQPKWGAQLVWECLLMGIVTKDWGIGLEEEEEEMLFLRNWDLGWSLGASSVALVRVAERGLKYKNKVGYPLRYRAPQFLCFNGFSEVLSASVLVKCFVWVV